LPSREDRLPSQQLPGDRQKPKPKPKYVPGVTDAPSRAAEVRLPADRPKSGPPAPGRTQPGPFPEISAPTGPPVPALQKLGYHGSLADLNDRITAATDAHQATFGYKPSPALALDIGRSQIPLDRIPLLFAAVPRTMAAKRAQTDIRGADLGYDHTEPLTVDTLVTGIQEAARSGDYHDYLDAHEDLIRDAQKNPREAGKINGALFRARRFETIRAVEERVNTGEITASAAHAEIRKAGFVPGGSAFHELKGVGGFAALAIGQVADALVHSPAGVYAVGKAVTLDTRDVIQHPERGGFKRTAAIGKATGQGFARDVRHPLANPGFLFLDVLGAASLGVGGAARLSAAGRAARAGEGVGAVAKGLVRKPRPQSFRIESSGIGENVVLIDNPLVAAAQKFVLKRRQKAADLRDLNGTPVPSALRSAIVPTLAQDLLDKHFSFERKIGRERDARMRVEHIADMALARELDAAAGRSIMQARAFSRFPAKVRGGLSRGEQKAIQVQSWDDPNPLQAEREFHERMIHLGVGAAKDHKRHLGDLKLAEKALANPSPRLQKALALTRETAAEMQDLKIRELGLSVETAEGRVAKTGVALREGETLARRERLTNTIAKLEGIAESQARKGAEPDAKIATSIERAKSELAATPDPFENMAGRASESSFYMPTQARGKTKRPPSDRQGFFSAKAGPYGFGPGRELPELKHEFTGKTLREGDFRIDATTMTSAAYARAVRASSVLHEWKNAWANGSKFQRTEYDVPVRDVNAISDKLRPIVNRLDEGEFTRADADLLPADMAALIREVSPDVRELSKEELKNVRWIDGRTMGGANDVPHVEGTVARVAQAINAPVRFGILYLRPAYILNKLGNHAMLIWDQGWLAVPNMARAMRLEKTYGESNAATIRTLVGSGKARSYVTGASGHVSKAVAEFWNRVADRDERVAAFLYYARRGGYHTADEMDTLLKSPEARGDLSEFTRRANKSLVEFDNQTAFEKNVLRHAIFVYPWVRGSAVWSLRQVMEHPAQTALLAKLGEQELDTDPLFKRVPEYFKRIGYVPIGFDHGGNPIVVNPTSVNTFSTMADFMAIAKAGTVGDKYANVGDLLGPFGKFAAHGVLGRDEFGNRYPGSQWGGAALEVLAGLPQLAALKRSRNEDGTLKPIDVTRRDSLAARLHSALKQTALSPGWLDGYGSLLAGGFSPRSANPDALAARYWADQDPAARHKHELALLKSALKIQGELLKQPVPANVRQAVDTQSEIEFAAKQQAREIGRTLTPVERAKLTLDQLADRIPDDKLADLRKQWKRLVAPEDVSAFQSLVMNQYGGGKALRQWDRDVRTVASFTNPAIFNEKAKVLFDHGLVPQQRYKATAEQLTEYGRKYLAFERQARDLAEQVKQGDKTAGDLRAFEDAHDKPVNGLPSFVRIAWTHQSEKDREDAVRSSATASWRSLSAFEKELLGRPSDAKVTAGWAKLDELVAEQRTKLAREGRGMPAGYERTLARYVERYYDAPGLTKDYDFSRQPLFQRLPMLAPVQQSTYRRQWTQVFEIARGYHRYIASDEYSHTAVRQAWRDYIASAGFQAWLGQHPGFKAEVDRNGRGLLEGLLA
jgi:hypothetical protein